MSEQVSPAPVAEQQHNNFSHLVHVNELLIISTAAVVAVILHLSRLARRSRNPIVKALITILSTLYIPLVTFTVIDVTRTVQAPSPLLIVSVILLHVIILETYGKKAGINRHSNIDQGDEFNPFKHLAETGWLGFLLYDSQHDALQDYYDTIYRDLMLPATIVLAINVSNVILASRARKSANRSFAVGRNANLVAGYMAELPKQHEQEVVAEYEQSPSRFMSDYPYLVLGEEKLKRVITKDGYRLITTNNNKYITLDKIWRCERKYLRHNEKNREVCLSFALFKLLRLRFEGMQPSESNNSERALNLVINGPFRDHRRAFRLVEMELAFLDDYLYSELPFTYHEKKTSIDLPDEVKKAVIDSLVRNRGVRHSPNHMKVINVPGAKEACQLTNFTERILVWHMATTHCEDHRPIGEPAIQSDNRKVASILSKYCAYLAASAPELLPGRADWNQFIVKGVREKAQSELRRWGTWRITKLMSEIRKVLHVEDERRPSDRPSQVYREGMKLGRQLIEVIEDEERQWEALAELWAEMLLSAALSNDHNAHAKSIEKGIEFITLVWALLSSVGINERCDQPNVI